LKSHQVGLSRRDPLIKIWPRSCKSNKLRLQCMGVAHENLSCIITFLYCSFCIPGSTCKIICIPYILGAYPGFFNKGFLVRLWLSIRVIWATDDCSIKSISIFIQCIMKQYSNLSGWTIHSWNLQWKSCSHESLMLIDCCFTY